jgi:hypothetical protein
MGTAPSADIIQVSGDGKREAQKILALQICPASMRLAGATHIGVGQAHSRKANGALLLRIQAQRSNAPPDESSKA